MMLYEWLRVAKQVRSHRAIVWLSRSKMKIMLRNIPHAKATNLFDVAHYF